MAHKLRHKTRKKVTAGTFHPLGATLTPDGVNFALYSQHAQEVYLLLFDQADGDPTDIIRFENRTRYIWHAQVRGLKAGQLYGYKVRGEYHPAAGQRFNEHKLLLDPYARAMTGKCHNVDDLLFAFDRRAPEGDLRIDTRDNTHVVPKGLVVDEAFDWKGEVRPERPVEKLIIYEVHVKGFTAHPSSGVRHPGTYLGMIEKIPYLKELGVNAVELLPVQEHYVEDSLVDRRLTNYWGYNTIGFNAPELSYGSQHASGCEIQEFKTLVRELHRAGIEVILDVVYNHTGEGNERGPTLSFKGIDNRTYYCLHGPPDAPYRSYDNFTGCGNSLNLDQSPVIRFVMDSLRYWVEVMHVDGFRFDLAAVMGREAGFFQKTASFFDAISQDPSLNRVKLIAEPWDLGTYQVGNFPIDWTEWNGRFRDTMRRFGRGDPGVVADLGFRLTGSADLYRDDGRSPYNSINFITCHDGFTLYDLVSYNQKHNEANLEENRDGAPENFSWSCGVEGETGDPQVLELRRRLVKNFVCYLFFSAGTPMILAGDEMLRTQRGNNNAYCHDAEWIWIDWANAEKNADVLAFFRKAIRFTQRFAVLHRHRFFTGLDHNGDGVPDITWYGSDLERPAWENPECRLLCFRVDASEIAADAGNYQLFFILNADPREQRIRLPEPPAGTSWHRVVDTSIPAGEDFLEEGREAPLSEPRAYLAGPRSTVVLLTK